MAAWSTVGFAIVLVGLAVLFTILRRRGGADPTHDGYRATTVTRVAKVTRAVAFLFVAVSTVGAASEVAANSFSPMVRVTLPVREFWPATPAGVELYNQHAQVVGGGFTQAVVSVHGLDLATRIWLTAGTLLQCAVGVIVGLLIADLCLGVLNKTLFRPGLIRGIRRIAVTVLAGGIAWQLCHLVGGNLAARQVLGASGQDIGLPTAGFAWDINFWPIGAAMVLFVLAAAFRHGGMVPKDAAGRTGG
ncbi:hypothetical protein [Specibacter sp. RAF43]|uniref:hypothetical protein n=1 Tax=Specibacter sp. RAF43 TaxID=3233057 RepID=UPI003F97BBBB